jgi:lambda repressor-like predicted transcriptional regulator
MRPRSPRLTLEPLVCEFGNISALARVLDRDVAQVGKWVHDGVPLYSADRIAVALGRHPVEIWPEWFSLPDVVATAA